MYIKPLKVGNVILENNLILAPMAGVTDRPFRIICKKFEAGLVCTEMASSRAIAHNDEKTKKLLNVQGEKKPISVQIFGSDVESMKISASFVSTFADIIDINMGCPAPKIIKNGDGSKLLLNLDLASKIISEVVKTANIPVTVKIRKGWDEENIVAVEIAKIAEECGASMITIHGRTRQEYYSGKSDLNIIKKVKENVKIPVIGNGDIVDEISAKKMFETTGVDGIMIGRGAIGNPWIFRNLIKYFKTGEKQQVIFPKDRLKVIIEHIELLVQEKGEWIAVHEIRKHINYYIKKLPEATKVRQKINEIETKKDLIDCLTEYLLSI